MPTRTPAIVFLLAHQDDEIGVYQDIENALAAGHRPHFVYLTSGSRNKIELTSRRERESLSALRRFNIPEDNIHFVGGHLGIADGDLINNLPAAWAEVRKIMEALEPVRSVVVHAYEGGHLDHDACHIIGARLSEELGCQAESYEFPMYRSNLDGWFPYTVGKPDQLDDTVFSFNYERSNFLKYCLSSLRYVSQWRSMIGLLPFFAIKWGTGQEVRRQRIRKINYNNRPNLGHILYERRGSASFESFAEKAREFADQRLLL